MKAASNSNLVTDVSFSSYLKPPDQEAAPASSQEHPNSADTELGIFEARKYFNEGVAITNDQTTTLSNSKRVSPIKDPNLNHPSDPCFYPRFSSASSSDIGYGPTYRNRSLASSEASWNSHTGLLGPGSDKNRGGASSRKNKVPRWLLFHSKCPCSGKNSVRVKENPKKDAGPNPNPNPNRERTVATDQRSHFRVSLNMDSRHVLVSAPPKKPLIDANSVTVTATSGFTFPILNATPPSSSPPPMKTLDDRNIRPNPPTVVDVPRDHDKAKKINCLNSTVEVENDDAASDASSDLFEIESITTQSSTYPITNHHHRQRDSLEEAIPRVLPLPCNNNNYDGRKLLVAGNHQCIEASNVGRIMTVVPEGGKLETKIGRRDYQSLLSAPEFERFPRIDLGRSARVIIGGGECDSDSRPRGSGLLSCRT